MHKKIKFGIIIFSIIMFLMAISFYFLWNPSQYNFYPKCPLYSITGMYCPGCGSQRAIHQIINGNIIEGIRFNYLLLLLFLVLLYQSMHFVISKLSKKTFSNILHQPITTELILVLVIVFWIFRNIKIYPFNELAP